MVLHHYEERFGNFALMLTAIVLKTAGYAALWIGGICTIVGLTGGDLGWTTGLTIAGAGAVAYLTSGYLDPEC